MSAESALHDALTHCIAQRLTFAAFRTPGDQITLWAQQTPDLDHVENGLWWEMNDVFLLSPFTSIGRTPLIRSDVELTFGDAEPAWHRLLECIGSQSAKPGETRPSTSRVFFEASVEKARTSCLNGTLEKVVVSRTISVDIGEKEAPFLFTEAVHARPEACVALVYTPEHGLWLGASPERLMLSENETVHIDALAGTAALDNASTDPASWGTKERHEQRLVTKGIVGALIDISAQTIVIDGPEVLQTGSLAHLRTRISATIEGRSVEELVNVLHPTAAVCGLPREAAKQAIAALEDRDRELYAGFWGPWSADGRMELFVNIRCMRLFAERADLHVGAGITAGSVPSLEWDETEYKADGWRNLFRTTAIPRNS